MGLADIALSVGRRAAGGGKRQPASIIDYIEAPWGLGIRLYPVQKLVLKAHYGIALDEKDKCVCVTDWRRQNERWFTEADYLRWLFDARPGANYSKGQQGSNIREVEEGHQRREMVLSVGRRSGKTTMASLISSYETYRLIQLENPQSYYGLPSGNTIQLTSVATDKEQAALLFNEVSGHFRTCTFFRPYIANSTTSHAYFQSPHDIGTFGRWKDNALSPRTIKITFRSCIAKGLRGPGNIVVILDEVAHFVNKGQASAEDVYNAVAPSTSAFIPKSNPGEVEGRIILISSPLGKQGHFYNMFQIGMRGGIASENMLCIQAPTWEVNPILPASEFEKHYTKDPRVFFTEYGAEFSDRTRGWIEDERELLDCVDLNHRPRYQAPPKRQHFVGLDLALANDATAIAIGHIEGADIVLDFIDKIQAGVGDFENQDRLKFDDVANWVKELSRRFYISEGIFDMWTGIAFEQALQARGIKNVKATTMTDRLNSQIYQNLKTMLWDRRLRLYDWPIPEDPSDGLHCEYIQELLELQAEYKSKYIVVVQAPQSEGKHDDLSDALARMVWVASQKVGKQNTIVGTRRSHESAAAARRIQGQIWERKKAMAGGSHPSRMIPGRGKRR